MQVEHDLTSAILEAMGGVMEAIGGIFYAWRLEAGAMQAILAEQSGVPVAEFQMAVDVLGQLAGGCTWPPQGSHTVMGVASGPPRESQTLLWMEK